MDSINRVLISISIFPSPNELDSFSKIRNIAVGVWLLLSQCIAFISSVVYFHKYISVDLEGSLYAIVQISGYSLTAYTYAMGYIQRKSIEKLFIKLRNVCNESKF